MQRTRIGRALGELLQAHREVVSASGIVDKFPEEVQSWGGQNQLQSTERVEEILGSLESKTE